MEVKDSKKCTEKYRNKCFEYIQNTALEYSIKTLDHEEIDEKYSSMFNRRMHQCLDEITDKRDVDMILVDGNHFKQYYSSRMDEFIEHQCVIKGDNTYKSIAAGVVY